jgi:hypothetical protein
MPLLAACAGVAVVWLDAQSLKLGVSGRNRPERTPAST